MRFPIKLAVAILACAGGLACSSAAGGDGGPGPSPTYTVGGTVSGLSGAGLVLTNNGSNELAISSGASAFAFPGSVSAGAPYSVSVKSQPAGPTQTCTPTNGSGTANANVLVAVSCVTNTYPVGGTISGLLGTGLTLLLNGAGAQSPIAGATSFSFPTVASGTAYAVTVGSQPAAPAQTCTVTGGTGTVAGSGITSVAVSCITTGFSIGGTVTGLAGSGLVLQNNGANDLGVPAGATAFSFPSNVAPASAYSVTVKSQPTAPAQTCTIANAAGTANGNVLVAVACLTNAYTVGGTISGLAGAGLRLVLNGGSPLTPAVGATTFAFPAMAPGASYTVSVSAHPTGPAQTCAVTNGTGTIGTANVTNVAVACVTDPANTYSVGGTISGLTGSGLTLLLNGGTALNLPPGSSTFAFPAIAGGAAYAVTVGTQPGSPAQTCTVTNGAGIVGTTNVTSVTVTCTTPSFTVGGTVSGLVGNGLTLRLNGGTPLSVASSATTFAFPAVPGGTVYSVTVGTQPSSPTQSCSVANATGTVGSANVTNVTVSCVTVFTIGGALINLSGSGLTLQLNGGTPLAITPFSTSFAFPAMPSGTSYTITVGSQPAAPGQTCNVTNGTGVVASANVTNVSVACGFNGLTVGGSIAGYTGTGLALRLNGGTPMVIPAGRVKFTFPDFLVVGQEYSVVIVAQPAAPVQTCTLVRAHGMIQATNPPQSVGNINIQCTTNSTSPLSGTYSLLQGTRRSFLTFWPDGTYSFASRADDPTCGASNGNGVEYGVYNWNATTGAFAIRTGAVDTNGGCGVWDATVTPAEGLTGTLTKSGGTLTLTFSEGVLTLTAVASTPSTIIGSFSIAAGNDGTFFTLLPDGSYLIVETQMFQVASVGATGYERGCYTSTTNSFTGTLGAGCLPDGLSPLDGNGNAGLSSDQGVAIPYVITGPNTITIGGDFLVIRILPN